MGMADQDEAGNEQEAQDDKAEEEENPDEDEIFCEPCGEAPIIIARSPGCPTHEEIEHHNVTHLPYRSWCPVCVQARGKEDDHRRNKKKPEETVPTIVMDYKAFGQDEKDTKLTSIVIRDKRTTMTAMHVCLCKGMEDRWIVDAILEDIANMGYTNIILKTDGEPALVQVAREVKKRRAHPTVLQHPPAYDPEANGVAERAVQEAMGQMRACKIGLEQRTRVKVETNWAILEWMAEHAGDTINRGLLGHDGKTPDWRLMGKPSTRPMLEMGEQVMAKPLRAQKSNKKLSLKSKWVFGTWLGMTRRSGEHLVALAGGGAVIKVRTVKRRTMADRWNGDAIKEIVATPRLPNPKNASQERVMPERLTSGADPGGDGTALPDVITEETDVLVRDFRITRKILDQFGITSGCNGCDGHLMGKRRAHSSECRTRIEQRMRDSDLLETRVKARDGRKIKEAVKATNGTDKGIDDEPNAEETNKVKVDNLPAPDTPQPAAIPPEDDEMGEGPDDGETDSDLEEDENKEEHSEKRKAPIEAESPGSSTGEVEAKRRRVLGAIQELEKLIELSKEQARRETRKRVYDVTRWVHAVLSESDTGKRHGPLSHATGQVGSVAGERPTPHSEEMSWWRGLYSDKEFLDDMNGFVNLDKEMVIAARKLEMDYFRKMRVYTKVPRKLAKDGGHKVISTKWLDTNKGDDDKPNYRSRLVGREIKRDKRLDLFAATPPLETIKFLAARCAQKQGGAKPWRLAVIDVRRAYFYAPAKRPIFVEIPVEDREPGDEDKVGRLELSLYGTRDAALNWAAEYSGFLNSLGFTKGIASPCNFELASLELNITVHGDDFLIAGPLASIRWFQNKMKSKYEIKSSILGPETEAVNEISMLGRVLRWSSKGIEYEPDQRHAELLVKELGLCGARPVSTPGTSDSRIKEVLIDGEEEYNREDLMDSASSSKYRALAARLNYLAMDRADVQFAAKEACRKMSRPIMADWDILKRIGRYLRGRPRSVQLFPFEKEAKGFIGFGDSDWAGEKPGMKSTSGGAVFLGKSMLKSWSSSQSLIALSSGEAELYALMKLTTQTVGLISMAGDFGCRLEATVQTDSTAAIGIVNRIGLGGKSRHLNVQYLWIQECIQRKEVTLKKVGTDQNHSDVLTKFLGREPHDRHVTAMGYEFREGRAKEGNKLIAQKQTTSTLHQSEEGYENLAPSHTNTVNMLTTPWTENRVRYLNDK